MSELLPCPFCGSADVDHKFSYFKLPAEEGGGTYGHEPGCNACGASVPAEIWNRRSALSQEAVRNEVLEEAAKVCDGAYAGSTENDLWLDGAITASSQIAVAIRALKK